MRASSRWRRGSLTPAGVLTPRRPLAPAGAIVAGSGCVAAGIGVCTAVVDHSGASGIVPSLLLPLLFLAYWGIQAWLIDAGAGMLGVSGRRRDVLAASGRPFLTWITYSLVALGEAAAARWLGSGSALAVALTWLTLPVLLWFLALTIRVVRRVYDIPTVNAFALALLPYAAVAGALLVLAGAAGALRG